MAHTPSPVDWGSGDRGVDEGVTGYDWGGVGEAAKAGKDEQQEGSAAEKEAEGTGHAAGGLA